MRPRLKRDYKAMANGNAANNAAKQAAPKRQKAEKAENSGRKDKVYSIPAILRRHQLPDGSIPLCLDTQALKALFSQHIGFDFIRSERNQRAAQEHLVVAPVYKLSNQGNKCYGIFTLQPLKKGTVLGRYRGKETQLREGEDYSQLNGRPYVFVTQRIAIDAEHAGSYSRFFNHSNNNNCVFVVERQSEVYVVANQDIPANAQLTVDYGPHYFAAGSETIFLQPTDSWKSSHELYIENERSYFIPDGNIHPLTPFICELTGTTEKLLQVPVGIELLDGETLDPLPKQITSLNFPILECEEKTAKIRNIQKEITLLMVSCFAGDAKAVDVLLKTNNRNPLKVNPNAQSFDGKTPLIYTALSKNAKQPQQVKIIKALMQSGASVYFADRNHKTVFHYCIDRKLYLCFAVLFKDLDLELFDNRVTSILTYCIEKRDYTALGILAQLTKLDRIEEFLFDIDGNNKIERLTEQGDIFAKAINQLPANEFKKVIELLRITDQLLAALDRNLHAELIQKLNQLKGAPSPELAPRRMDVDEEKPAQYEQQRLFAPSPPLALPASAAPVSAAHALLDFDRCRVS